MRHAGVKHDDPARTDERPTIIKLTTAQSDRAAGALLAMASRDALGAGYEFGPLLGSDVAVVMDGGGSFGWASCGWTEDTFVAVAIAAKDVGVQTRQVLGLANRAARQRDDQHPRTPDLHRGAAAPHDRTDKTAGNGLLICTALAAVASVNAPTRLVAAMQTAPLRDVSGIRRRTR